jgi:hypothetical protein
MSGCFSMIVSFELINTFVHGRVLNRFPLSLQEDNGNPGLLFYSCRLVPSSGLGNIIPVPVSIQRTDQSLQKKSDKLLTQSIFFNYNIWLGVAVHRHYTIILPGSRMSKDVHARFCESLKGAVEKRDVEFESFLIKS